MSGGVCESVCEGDCKGVCEDAYVGCVRVSV